METLTFCRAGGGLEGPGFYLPAGLGVWTMLVSVYGQCWSWCMDGASLSAWLVLVSVYGWS